MIVGQFDDISAVHGNPSVGVSQVTRAAVGRCVRQTAKPAPSSLTLSSATAMIVSICSVINDAGKIDEVRNKITEAITSWGRVSPVELTAFRNVNRVFLVGEGLPHRRSYPSGLASWLMTVSRL
ncbi:hypothetical protein ACHWWK_27290 [Klebsiella pneumoniae]